jgi:TolB protein
VAPPPLSATIAFQSARDGDTEIFTWDGTTLRQLTSNAVADEAPDWLGGRIVYGSRACGESDIWVMNEDGSSPANLTASTPGTSEFGPKWSPDGSLLAFNR